MPTWPGGDHHAEAEAARLFQDPSSPRVLADSRTVSNGSAGNRRCCTCLTPLTKMRVARSQRGGPSSSHDRFRRDAIARRQPPRRFLFLSRRRAARYRNGSPIERPLRHASERRAHCRVERISFAHRPRVQRLGLRVLPFVRSDSRRRTQHVIADTACRCPATGNRGKRSPLRVRRCVPSTRLLGCTHGGHTRPPTGPSVVPRRWQPAPPERARHGRRATS